MNTKTLAVLTVVAGGLVAMAFWSGGKETDGRIVSRAGTVEETVFFPHSSVEDVARVVVQRQGGQTLDFKRDGKTDWTIETPKGPRRVGTGIADGALLNNIQKKPDVQKATRATVVGERESSYAALGLEEATAPLLTFYDAKGSEIEKFYVGKSSRDPHDMCFVRRPGDKRSYRLSADFSDNFNREKINDWRAKRFFADVKPGGVNRVQVEDSATTGTFDLRRVSPPAETKDVRWALTTSEGEKEPESPRATALARNLGNLSVSEFLDDNDTTTTLGSDVMKVTLSIDDDPTSKVLLIGGVPADKPSLRVATSESMKNEPVLIYPDYMLMQGWESLMTPPKPAPVAVPRPAPQAPDDAGEPQEPVAEHDANSSASLGLESASEPAKTTPEQ